MPHDKPFEMAEALQPTPKWIHDSAGTSFGRCCCLVSFLLISLTTLGAAILFIVFVIKPKKPIFHLHSIQLDSFKLNTTSSKEVHVCSPMASLLFVTQNPNKLGIAYSSTDLGILYGGVPVGVIEVPKFYQPPHGRNVTVPMHASLETLNVTSFFNAGSLSYNDTRIEIQIIGGIRAQGHILNFPLPRIKDNPGLQCDDPQQRSKYLQDTQGPDPITLPTPHSEVHYGPLYLSSQINLDEPVW